MGLNLDDAERTTLLAEERTGILTTLRRDGRPVSLPVWFVALDGELYVQTPRRAAKVKRAAHDARGSFLVETGDRWVDLTALHLDVEISLVDPDEEPALHEKVRAAIADKYDAYRLRTENLPPAVQKAYGDMAVLRLSPTGSELSWANSKIRLPGA